MDRQVVTICLQMWEHQAICHGNMRVRSVATQMMAHLALVRDSSSDSLFKVVQSACGSHIVLALVQLWGSHLCEPKGGRDMGQNSQSRGRNLLEAYTGETHLPLVSPGVLGLRCTLPGGFAPLRPGCPLRKSSVMTRPECFILY